MRNNERNENEHLPDEVDVELGDEDDSEPDSDRKRGLFVVFKFSSGRRLELHVPNAKGVQIGGHSDAMVPSYFLINDDGSIETSGSMVLVGGEDLIRKEGQ